MSTTPFCTDIDLLDWEPNVLRDAAFVSQTLLTGEGELSSEMLTIASGSFDDAGVKAGHVAVVGSELKGCFPIVAIETAQSLKVSVIYEGLGDDPIEPKSPPLSGTVPFVIRTFWPQRVVVSELLAHAAGIGVARTGETPAAIVNPQTLRRACALGTLQLIYSALAAASTDEPQYAVRAEMYERLYRRALRGATVDIDLNGDGEPDARRMLSVLTFRRI